MRLKRLAADIVDILLCAILAAFFSVLPAAVSSGFRTGTTTLALVGIIMTYIFFLLKDVFERSFGKRLFRIKIVNWEGKQTTLGQRFIRNIPLVIFPVSFILTIAGYDTIGDNLAATCVVGENESGTPAMKKGNNVFRMVALLVCASVVVITASVYIIRDLVIKNSDGYDVLTAYMQGDEIAGAYGSAPVWKARGYDKTDEGYVYTVEVNGKKLEVSTVKVNNKWFVLGVQTDTINSIVGTIEKIVSDKTVYLSLVDLDVDGKDELLEFCTGEDSDTLCNIYSIDTGEPAGSISYDNGSVASVGKWTLFHDINGTDRIVVEYSHYNSVVSEKITSMIEKSDGGFVLREIFKEVYTTGEKKVVDDEGNETSVKAYDACFYYNGRSLSPTDFNSNRANFDARYTPVSGDMKTFRWQSSEDKSDQALDAATTLLYEKWAK